MKTVLIKAIAMGILACITGLFTGKAQAQSPKLGKSSIKAVVAAMTLEEKAKLVTGTGLDFPDVSGKQKIDFSIMQPPTELVPGAAGTSYSLPRLGISPMVLSDGPAGMRINPVRPGDSKTYYCTAFPVAVLLASTWDPELVTRVGAAMGNEILEYGADVLLAPAINIHRNPLCGRNFEYYSEDPYVTGQIAAAMVKGVESEGVGVSIKHFAANNAETNRNSLNTIVSERALREIYLEGFRIAVQESSPWTVMSSYNLINGTYASESPDLLTSILRNDWGFKGFVMTDWFGGKDPIAQMKAGNDLLMPGTPDQINKIIQAVKDGKLEVAVLDRNVEKILNIMLLSPRFKGYKYSDKPDLKAHAEVARAAAAEGMVLLKNEGALPFGNNVKNIAAFGNTSYDIIPGGTGSGFVNVAYKVPLTEGLQNAGYKVNEDLAGLYNSYLNLTKSGRPPLKGFMAIMGSRPIEELSLNKDIITGMANVSDAAIITIGRNAGEGRDRTDTKGDFQLNDSEQQLIKNVSDAFKAKGKKVVVVLNIGGVIETASWRDEPDAILLAWQGGQETGNSVADVLSGKVNPSGKLAITFPVNYEDVPNSKTFPGKELVENKAPDQGAMSFGRSVPAVVTYDDGIYVGYRYYETFKVKPAFEFGFGKSYTNFTYSNIKLSSSKFNGSIKATIDIKNTGSVAGKEVAELYITAPSGKLDKPVLELKGFAKTKLLQPGESQTLSFVIDSRRLSSFDTTTSSWIAEAGKYEVRIGASSQDMRQTAAFDLGRNITVKKESVSLVPKEKIAEIKP